jgi:UDP-N-acetylglucosamine 2-epimerase (non-hydrolysing)
MAVQICLTSQHRDLLSPVLDFFNIQAHHDLNVMAAGQTPSAVASRVLEGVSAIIEREAIDLVVVQGDTTSALAGGLAAFYARARLAHVEAGLRSGDLALPFPEEGHRRMLDVLADYLFVPTSEARDHLLHEGAHPDRIYLTGNTGIDALFQAEARLRQHPRPWPVPQQTGDKIVLLTTHRRESFGKPLEQILAAMAALVARRSDVRLVFPVHPNPVVREAVTRCLSREPRIHLLKPLDYPDFIQAMLRADLIVSDSGGVQEEAPALGKRVLVLRDTTERPEGIAAGAAELVGTDPIRILERMLACLDEPSQASRSWRYLYGDGGAAAAIAAVLCGRAPAISKAA